MITILTTNETQTNPTSDTPVTQPKKRGRKGRREGAQTTSEQIDTSGKLNVSELKTESETERSTLAQLPASVEPSPKAVAAPTAVQERMPQNRQLRLRS